MIGDWIKAARKARGLTQADLAARVGTSEGYIYMLESNRRPSPRREILLGLARAFDTTVDDLLNQIAGEELQKPPSELLRGLDTDQNIVELEEDWPHLSEAERAGWWQMARDLAAARDRYEQEVERLAQIRAQGRELQAKRARRVVPPSQEPPIDQRPTGT